HSREAIFIPPLQAAKTLSISWQTDSMSFRFTARAAPLRLCASRKIVSRISRRFGAAGLASRSTRPEATDCKCSSASTAKASRSLTKNSSSVIGINPNRFLHFEMRHEFLQDLAYIVQLLRGSFRLPGARDCLGAGGLDVIHGHGHLIHSH